MEMTQGLSHPRLIPPQCLCPHKILSDIVYPISAIKLFGSRRLIQNAAETLPTNDSIATLANDTSKMKNWDKYPLASHMFDEPNVWNDGRTPNGLTVCITLETS